MSASAFSAAAPNFSIAKFPSRIAYFFVRVVSTHHFMYSVC
jgi:hypothetical protein